MSHCEKCINYDMCNYEYKHQDTNAILTFFPNNTDCPWFKNKNEYIKKQHGKWLDMCGLDIYQCSLCRREVQDSHIELHKYCLHCGAEMEVRNVKK